MISDFRYALRQMAKHPGYAATVILTLAFGIAVNTQIFAAVTAIFLKPMPVRDPGRLVAVIQRSSVINLPHGSSFMDFQDLRASSKNLTDFIAFRSAPAHVSLPGKSPNREWVEAVTPDSFQKAGIPMMLGRSLEAADGELPPGVPVAVLTHRYWKNQLGGDAAVLGRSVIINGSPYTVVGVASPGFESFSYMFSVAAFVPSGCIARLQKDGENLFKYRGTSIWSILCYLRDGASINDANAEITVFSDGLARDYPDEHRQSRFQAVMEQRARPLPTLTDFTFIFVSLFAGLVTLVLVIACANVANLMVAQAVNREKELVVRSALGASRARLIRQLLVESVVLSIAAGLAGYVLSVWGGNILQQSFPASEFPMRNFQDTDWRVWFFTAFISLVTGVAAGLIPALRSSRIDINEGLKRNAGQQLNGGKHRFRNALVIGQVAMSCVVLVSSALFFRALEAAKTMNFGFNPEGLTMLSVDLDLQGYDQERGLRFQKQVLERVHALPGVKAAHFTQHFPFSASNDIVIRSVWPENPTVTLPEGRAMVMLTAATPGLVSDLGISVVKGRDLLPSDDEKSRPVAVINEAMAKAFWPGADPIGQHFRRDWQGGPAIEVVGVVPTGKYLMLSEEPRPYYYAPFAQSYGMPATLVVRATSNAGNISRRLSEIVHEVDPDLPVYHQNSFEEHMNSSGFGYMPLRMGRTMAGIQGSLALALAIVGLYSVVSYGVSRRVREIGLRMALGATARDVMMLVSREGMRLTLIGLTAGLLMALLLSFGLSKILYGVHPADPVAFAIVTLLLAGTAALACAIPARRAAKVDPMNALRSD
jgi:predicted permease